MRLRSKLAVRAAKFTSTAIKKMHMGSGVTLPGLVARLIDPKILSEMSAQIDKKTIVTMGTNGKTTTNSLLCKVLEDAGHTVIINRTGANMLNGIISAFVLATDKQGLLHADYACIEVDEIASVRVLPQLQPDCALLTNISRDQLDRFGEVDITYNMVKTAIHSVPKTKVVINCDDVLSYTLAMEGENPYVTYGISEQIFDDFSRSEIRESIFCRHCGKKLEYDFFHYGQLGVYHCPNCGLAHPTPDYTACDVLFHDEVYDFSIDGVTIHSSARSPYNIYNTLSAYATLKALEADTSGFKNTIENFDYGNNRESIFTINSARVQLHLAKNPIGFQQKISLVLKDTAPKDIIIQINDTYQDGEDISWLWDVDFQYLADANTNTILTAGTRKYDMGLRLKYEDISCDSTTDLRASILDLTQNGTKNLYVIVNYSGLYRTNHLLTALQEETKGQVPGKPQATDENVKSDLIQTMTSDGTSNVTQAVKLTIGHLYPDLLNLYGDRGNIQCLRKRLEWRGIEAEVIPFLSGDAIDFSKLDIVLLGGGSDREQELVCEYLKDIKDDFKAYVEDGGVVLAVCGGYQLLGNYYKTDKKMIEGLSILDITTEWQPTRLIRNIILNSPLFETPVVGFENHGGRTYIGSHTPFGKVFFGLGNTGKSGYEGVVYKNVIATYLHGPLLPKNPHVCDYLLERALKKKYDEDIVLDSLTDELEHKANQYLVDRYSDKKYVLKETIKRYT